jgi:RNA polymerase primary sigma factor
VAAPPKRPDAAAPPKRPENIQQELKALAENLPYKAIEMLDFKKGTFQPVKVRQPRRYVSPDSSMQAIGRFLVERGTVELLTPEQTMDLFKEVHWCACEIKRLSRKRCKTSAEWRQALVSARQYISEIEAAEEELFIANRRLVVSCVKPFFWIGQVWLGDFLQEGSKALANAIRKFDCTRGTPFYSYSQKAVQNRLRNFFRDHVRSGSFGIRPSREMMLVKNIVDTWRRDYNEEPADDVVAKIADMPVERVTKVRAFVNQWEHMPAPPVSLDAMIGEDGANLYEVIEDLDVTEASHAAEASEVWQAIEQLPDRSKYIMKLRFIEGRTLEETGKMLNLTRARIKQIQDASLKRIRQILGGGRGTRHGVR